MLLAVTRTSGQSRSSSCSVRLLPPCCLQLVECSGQIENDHSGKTANTHVTLINRPHGALFAVRVRQFFQILVPPKSTNHLCSALNAANHGQHRAADNKQTETDIPSRTLQPHDQHT